MRPIRHPDTDGVDELAGGDRCRMADQRNQLPPAARLDLEDREAGVRVVEGHTLDAAHQRLAIRPRVGSIAANGSLLPGSMKMPSS
jgi:hypothetical protein